MLRRTIQIYCFNMEFTFINNNLLSKEYLSEMFNGGEVRQACVDAIHRTTDLEQLLQLRVELLVLTIRLRESPTPPHLYAFLPQLLGDLQSKITAEKLRLKDK